MNEAEEVLFIPGWDQLWKYGVKPRAARDLYYSVTLWLQHICSTSFQHRQRWVCDMCVCRQFLHLQEKWQLILPSGSHIQGGPPPAGVLKLCFKTSHPFPATLWHIWLPIPALKYPQGSVPQREKAPVLESQQLPALGKFSCLWSVKHLLKKRKNNLRQESKSHLRRKQDTDIINYLFL